MIKEMTDLYEAFVAGCTSGADLEGIALAWQEMGERIRTKTATGTMSTVELDLAYRLATNVWALTNQTLRLEEDHDAQLEKLSAKLSTIAAQDYPGKCLVTSYKLQCSNGVSSLLLKDEICFMNKSRSRKRGASPAVGVKKVPSNNGLPHREDDAMISDVYQPVGVKPTDHIREWFLQHLASPYPSAVEKDSLSELSGIPRSKIDSDMTNWRRRAGWTDIKDNWANGSRDAMRLLIERVESGQEKRKGVREAVEKMKAYLERREEERVGDWVKEVSDECDRRSHLPSLSLNPLHTTSVTYPAVLSMPGRVETTIWLVVAARNHFKVQSTSPPFDPSSLRHRPSNSCHRPYIRSLST